MSKQRRKALVSFLVAALASALLVTVALGQDEPSGNGSPAANDASARGVPRGPKVDFCPTPEQTEAHLRRYGFDYKPTVACTRGGRAAPPSRPIRDDPDDALSDEEACKRDKALLRNAEPLPDRDGDPKTLEGRLSDGREVIVGVMGKVERGWTIRDEASVLGC
jgi:hypothetical protein